MLKQPDWVSSEELVSAVNDRTPLFIPNALDNLDYNWDDVIECLNIDNVPQKWMQYGGFVCEKLTNRFITIVELGMLLKAAFPPRTNDMTIHLYGSFSHRSETFGMHRDTADVFFIQGMGKTKFDFEFNRSYNLRMGDCLYIPRGVYHDPKPITPRFGFSIGLENGRYD